MAVVGDPLDQLRARLARRLRWFTVYHAALVIVAVITIGWIALASESQNLLWAFIFIAIVMPSGVPLVWLMNRRGFGHVMDAFEAFRPHVVDAKASVSAGYLLVLDGGIVFGADPRTNAIRFVAFFTAGGALMRPSMAQAERWAARIRGMQSAESITMKKGPSEARAELERFRIAFGARWYMLFLRQVKSERMTAEDPMWHEILAFFIPKWWTRASAVAAEFDALRVFLEAAKANYFPRDTRPT